MEKEDMLDLKSSAPLGASGFESQRGYQAFTMDDVIKEIDSFMK